MPPNGFTSICDATRIEAIVSLLGVITHVSEKKKSGGTDWVQNFTIQDDFSIGAIGGGCSIGCRLFRPTPDSFPKMNVNDVALLRDFVLKDWKFSSLGAISRRNSSLLIFPASRIPVPELSQPYQSSTRKLPYFSTPAARDPTILEQIAVIDLNHAAADSKQPTTQHPTMVSFRAPMRDRLSLIQDMVFDRFYDIRAQVVNIYYTNFGTVDLKVTDYSTNKHLVLYVDPDDQDFVTQGYKWTGPLGQVTMNVLLYEPHAAWARQNVTAGDFVFLRNVHVKLSKASKMEGALHEDKVRPEKIDIRKLINQSDIAEIQRRQKEHEKTYAKKSALDVLQSEPKKSSAKASMKKKAEKKARQRAQKERELEEIARKAEECENERSGVNHHIKAAYPEIQLSSISEIVHNPKLRSQTRKHNDFTLPFLNCRHRSRVRIVDFFPPELELFAHSTSDPSWDKRAKRQDLQNNGGGLRWEWGFVLLLEDANIPPNTVSEKLRVVVSNESAQYLLDMDARDIKRDGRYLKKLEEKLFILWGNLLELKTELRDKGSDMPLPPGDNRLQNKPFDCCIEEYGHEVHMSDKNPARYQRMHRLAQTKIVDN